MEKFLIFNQQFVTLIRAGLPILKGLDLLADRLGDPKLGPYIKSVRDEVRNGTLLSEAFRLQGIFPKIYVTSVMAGEKSGSLVEVLDRFVNYQKLNLAVRKKVMVSLMYPCVLIVLVLLLMVFLVTYVVPTFAGLYTSMQAKLPTMTVYLIAIGTTARAYILVFVGFVIGAIFLFRWWRGAIRRAKKWIASSSRRRSWRHLAQVPGRAALAHPQYATRRRHSAGAFPGDRRRFAQHAAAQARNRRCRQERPRGPAALGIAPATEAFSRTRSRYD